MSLVPYTLLKARFGRRERSITLISTTILTLKVSLSSAEVMTAVAYSAALLTVGVGSNQ